MGALDVANWINCVQLVGQDPSGNPVLVALDANGQLYIVIQGELAGITGSVTVDQSEKDREIQGADGATLRTVAVDANGQIIMVPRGQSGNYLAVDADGFLATLMKALYAGTTLKTVACDDQGRMIMIPTDPADVWGNAISMGNAELAAIFSFAKQYDRRGQVIFIEGFEAGIRGWETILSGTNAAVNFSSAQAKSGGFSCELVAGTTSEKYARIKRSFPFPIEGKMAFEFSFTLDPDTETISAWLLYYDGTKAYRFTVTYDKVNTRLGCGGADGFHTILDNDLDLYTRDTQFHTIKVVVDIEAIAFVRVMCDGNTYSATTAAPDTFANTEARRLELHIQNHAIDAPALPPNIWVDNIILTQKES